MALRSAYFLLAGWGLGIVMAGVAWFLMITIVGLPVGIWITDRIPVFVSLRPECMHRPRGWNYLLEGEQRPVWRRLAYFIFVGSWLSALWMALAYLLIFTVIFIPAAFSMFERVPQVATLYRPE